MAPNARLIILEAVLPSRNTPSPGRVLDMNMLVMSGGRERTEQEFGAILQDAGFKLGSITPIDAMHAAAEALPTTYRATVC